MKDKRLERERRGDHMDLGNNERRMLKSMLSAPSRNWNLNELLDSTGWGDQVHVAGAGKSLYEQGLVEISETTTRTVNLASEGHKAASEELLEDRIWQWMQDADEGDRSMQGLFAAGFERHEAGPGIGLLKSLGIKIEDGSFVFSNASEVSEVIAKRSEFIEKLSQGPIPEDELDSELVSHFAGRKNLISIEETTSRTWTLTNKGSGVKSSDLGEIEQIGQLTPEILQGESWRGAEFKPFDVNAPAPTPAGGRPHPMLALIERIRSVFLEMGFSEIEGNYKRYSANIGYTLNQLILEDYEISFQVGWGWIDRYGKTSFSSGASLAAIKKIPLSRIKITALCQLVHRTDLGWMYGESPIRASIFVGLSYNLKS